MAMMFKFRLFILLFSYRPNFIKPKIPLLLYYSVGYFQTFVFYSGGNLSTSESLKAFGSFHRKVNLKNGQNEIVFDRLWYPPVLLFTIGAKLIAPHGGL